MDYFSRFKRKIIEYYLVLLRAIISTHKRDKKLIVYGGALDLFIDNAKHLFIINNQSMPQYRHVWLTRSNEVLERVRSLGFEAELSDSKIGRNILYHAGMVIYDNRIDEFASHNLASGAIRFNLWHGIPGKRIGLIKTDPPKPYSLQSAFKYKYLMKHTYGDYVLTTSKNMVATMSAAFEVLSKDIIVSDQPRNHVFYMTPQELDGFLGKYGDEKEKRLYNELKNEKRQKVIYMPTFRDADPEYIYKAIPDWDDFNSFLGCNNIVLYLKVHRVTPLPQGLNYSNIRVIDNSLDIYPILPLFDRLITDYSSIMFDYALMRKPIIIYDYDLESYVANSRNVFKSFRNLLKKLSEAKGYDELKRLMTKIDSTIERFPLLGRFTCVTSIIKLLEPCITTD